MTQKQYSYLTLSLITVFVVTRISNLDADIPFGWSIAQYQHFDEMFYSLSAINLFHYGTWDVEKFGLTFIDAEQNIAIPVWQLLQFIFLETFDNKLIAIRFPAVLAGAGVYILYLRLLSRLNADFERSGNFAPLLLILFAAFPLVDPIFYLSNTINEPTIFRLLFATWLFYLFVDSDEISKRKAFWLGVLAAFSALFIYLYNLFLPLFAFLVLLQKVHRHTLLSFISGAVVVVLVWLGLFEWLHDVSLPQTFSTISANGARGMASFAPAALVRRIVLIFSTNFLSVSPALLVLFFFGLVGLPMLSANVKQQSTVSKTVRLSWVFVIAYILQSLFLSDFIQRKGLILYLPVLIVSYMFVTTISSISAFKVRSRFLFSAAMVFIAAGLAINVFHCAKQLEAMGFFAIDKWVAVTSNSYLAVCSIFIVAVLALVIIPKISRRNWVTPVILAVTIIFNVHLIIIHRFLNSARTFAETIAAIGNLPSGYFIGNFSYAFTLGNKQHKPFLYLYTAKFLGVADRGLGFDGLQIRVIDKFIANVQVPVYTVVQGGQQRDEVLKHYASAKVVYANLAYRDVETYYDYRVSELPTLGNNEIYVLRVNS